MDSGLAFLLGVLIGQWVMLFVIWRAVLRLVDMIAEQRQPSPAGREIIVVNSEEPADRAGN